MQLKIDYSYHYQKWHHETEEHSKIMFELFKANLKQYLPDNKNIKILDVGCGMGHSLLSLKKLGYNNISGIEVDSGQVESCVSKGLNVILSADTIKDLKNSHEKYDLILLLDVLEHIPTNLQLEFMEAIYSTLHEGGQFICTVPNANSTISSRWRYIDWTHQTSFTEHSLDFLLHSASFKDIKISGSDPFIGEKPSFYFLFRFFSRLIRRMEMVSELGNEGFHIPLSVNLLAIASKTSKN